MTIPHYEKVNMGGIKAVFTEDQKHRASLFIPFLGRGDGRCLCVIGQNPSDANEEHADSTLYYLERLVFQSELEYSSLVMLNLFSRIDTNKDEIYDLERPETIEEFNRQLKCSEDVLLVTGAKKKDGGYHFGHKLRLLKPEFLTKNLLKISLDPDTSYPPHPGNPKILYSNYAVKLVPFCL